MIVLRSKQEVERLRQSNQVVAEVMKKLNEAIVSGTSTLELDAMAEKYLRKMGAVPAFKGYRGYQHTICASINEEVVHGIPSKRKLKEGDIISVDIGAKLDGYFGDHAVTYPVGQVDDKAKALLKYCEEALWMGIGMAKPGNRLFDISHAIQKHAESGSYAVVKVYVGHGIGTKLHEEPQVPNFGAHGTGPELHAGMVIAIEPMLNEGESEVEVLDDKWTVVTADGGRSAHFEHSVVITDSDPEILSVAA